MVYGQPLSAKRFNIIPYLLLALTNLFWSFNFIIGKVVTAVVPPATVSFFRWLPPALFFLCLSWHHIHQNWPLIKQKAGLLFLLGATGYTLNSICVYEAVRYTTTINTSFINAFNPVLIALAGYLLFRYPLSGRQALGFLLAMLGVLTILFKGDFTSILRLEVNLGDLFMIGSISFWAIHTVLYKRWGAGAALPRDVVFTMMMCCGVILSMPCALMESWTQDWNWLSNFTWIHLLGILALNIFPSVLAYSFWNRALTQVSVNEVAISQYLIPVFTSIISVFYLGEKLHGFHLVGGGLIFLGVLVTIFFGSSGKK